MLLQGTRGVILGVANKRSIAWAIAKACHRHGAQLAFSALNPKLGQKIERLAGTLEDAPGGAPPVWPCDVMDDESLDGFFSQIAAHFDGRIDFVVHAVAFADRKDLDGAFLDTSRPGFHTALDVSAYSLPAMLRRAAPHMKEGGAALALTYLGACRAFPSYNVMGVAKAALESSVRYLARDLGPQGVRVNAISAGPIATLSARGIRGFSEILHHYKERSPLGRNTDADEVADASVFLLSSMARGITGGIVYVDNGYRTAGM